MKLPVFAGFLTRLIWIVFQCRFRKSRSPGAIWCETLPFTHFKYPTVSLFPLFFCNLSVAVKPQGCLYTMNSWLHNHTVCLLLPDLNPLNHPPPPSFPSFAPSLPPPQSTTSLPPPSLPLPPSPSISVKITGVHNDLCCFLFCRQIPFFRPPPPSLK